MLGLFLDKVGSKGYVLIIGFMCLFISFYVFYGYNTCPEFDKCY